MESTQIKEIRARIGRAIRKLREEENISAEFLAKVIGLTQPTISRIENGTTSISAEQLCFLAISFNRPISFFIGKQSSIVISEEDIIIAGLVFYGATHLKSKRSINISEHYKTFPDLLNAALKFSDNTRIATAIAAAIFKQALKNNLKPLQILSTITNIRLQAGLHRITELTSNACLMIKNNGLEKIKSTRKRIQQLNKELIRELNRLEEFETAEIAAEEFSRIDVTPRQIATFIDQC